MAAPAIANVNTVGGGLLADAPTQVGASGPAPTTFRFSKTFQHYIGNNNTSVVPTTRRGTINGETPVNMYNEGWYHIPFTSTWASTTQADRDLLALGKRVRVVEQGFHIKRLQPIQQQISAPTSVTSISNSFVSAPCAMLYKDNEHELFEGVVKAGGATQIWRLLPSTAGSFPNVNFTQPFPVDYVTGELAIVDIAPTPHATTGTAVPVTTNFDIMNGGNVTFLPASDSYSYTWKNPVKWWQNGTDVLVATGGDSVVANFLPTDTTLNRSNMATGIQQNLTAPPVLHLIRVPPLRDTLGNIIISMELIIEYYMVVEMELSRMLVSHRIDANGASVLPAAVAPKPANPRVMMSQLSAQWRETHQREAVEAAKGKYKH